MLLMQFEASWRVVSHHLLNEALLTFVGVLLKIMETGQTTGGKSGSQFATSHCCCRPDLGPNQPWNVSRARRSGNTTSTQPARRPVAPESHPSALQPVGSVHDHGRWRSRWQWQRGLCYWDHHHRRQSNEADRDPALAQRETRLLFPSDRTQRTTGLLFVSVKHPVMRFSA
jgi:hypothetical protein